MALFSSVSGLPLLYLDGFRGNLTRVNEIRALDRHPSNRNIYILSIYNSVYILY